MAKVGFIGLGIMGKPMAKNLLKAKHELVVYDIVKAAQDEVVAAGAKGADCAKAVAILVTRVSRSQDMGKAVE